jgi:glycosyltransferase involved in cell wall biosynthesis
MSESVAFSVIIPLHNKVGSIVHCLNSVRAQTVQPFEVLVIDNNSSDGGADLARAYDWDRVRVLEEHSQGVSQARNAGIAAAKGSHLAFLDADDYWLPAFLERMAALVLRFPEAGWYAGGYVFRTKSGDRRPMHPGLEGFEAGLLPSYFGVVAFGDMIATASSVCIPRALFEVVAPFAEGEKIGEDQDLWARIALGYPVAFDPELMAIYDQEGENMATKTAVARELWPFIGRLAKIAEGLQGEERRLLELYLSRQLVGQASQLVLAGAFGEAQRLLGHRLAGRSGWRYRYWLVRAYLRW